MRIEITNYYGDCVITISDKILTISSWFIRQNHRNKGHGKELLSDAIKSALKYESEITEIRYIWNQQNEYVGRWLHKFDAKPIEDLNISKNNFDDTWDAHIYVLDKNKFLKYLEV